LPHGLIDSFKSTLDEVLEADLLLHVVDISHENYREQMRTTENVLREIGASHVPQILVFNKVDKVDDPFLAKIMRSAYPGSISMSAYRDEDANRLREHIYKFFETNFVKCRLVIPSNDLAGISAVYKNCMVLDADYEKQNIAVFDVRTTREYFPKIKHYVMDGTSVIGPDDEEETKKHATMQN
jgi:GTP-binding protein HflX